MGYTFPTSSNDNEILTGSIIPVGDRKFVASKSGGATFLNPVSDYSTSPEYFRGSILEQDDTTYALLHLQQTSYSDSEDDSYFSIPYAANNIAADTDSKFGTNAASFNGTDSYIEYKVNDIIDVSGPFTWECWIKANTSTSLRTVMGQVSDTQVMSGLFVQTKDNQIKILNGTTELLSIANDLTGSYHHLAICKFTDFYEQEVLKVFKNGELIGETSGTNVDNLTRQYIPFSLGKDVGSNYFSGKLQELRVTQGFARYHENFTPPTTPFNVSNDGVTHLKFNNDSYLPTDNSDDVAFLTVVSQEEEIYTGGIDQNTEVMLAVENNTLVDKSIAQERTLNNATVTENNDSNFVGIKSWPRGPHISGDAYTSPYLLDWDDEDFTIDFWAKKGTNGSHNILTFYETPGAPGFVGNQRFAQWHYFDFTTSGGEDYVRWYFTHTNGNNASSFLDSKSPQQNPYKINNGWNHYAYFSPAGSTQILFFVNGTLVATQADWVSHDPTGGKQWRHSHIYFSNRYNFGFNVYNQGGLDFDGLYQEFRLSKVKRYDENQSYIPRDTPYNNDTAREITNANLMFVNNGKVKSLTTTSNFTNLKRDYIELNQQTTLPSSNNTIVYVDSNGELRTSGSFGDKKISLTGV